MSSHRAEVVTPPLDLSGYSDDTLLTTFAALTHRIHEAHALRDEVYYTRSGRRYEEQERELRAQRDQVRLECLRRMGGR